MQFYTTGQKKGHVFVVDTVASNQLPGLSGLYNAERTNHMTKPDRAVCAVPEADHSFELYTETDMKKVNKLIGRILSSYMQVSIKRIIFLCNVG